MPDEAVVRHSPFHRLLATASRPVKLDISLRTVVAYATVNALILLPALPNAPIDWNVLAGSLSSFHLGTLYEASDVPFLWSPVVPWLLAPIVPLGYAGWIALHLIALVFLRNPTLILLALLSAGFWADVAFGNAFTFAVVAGIVGWHSSRPAALLFVALFTFAPRPVLLPLFIMLLLRDSRLRAPALGVLVVHGLLVAITGYGGEWIASLITVAPFQADVDLFWAPTSLFGPAWLLAGIPIGAWLMMRGYHGLAGLAWSPYIFPQYLFALLCDIERVLQRRIRARG